VFADLSDAQNSALKSHHDLLLRWNRVVNLTSESSIDRHYGESLFVGEHLPAGLMHIVDIGSGAGFPGFPIAVLRPDCLVTLVEAHQRKAVFLMEASRIIPNIRVVARRAEELDESFDWAVSRAVSYRDLAKCLKKLARKAALLTGAEDPPAELGFVWDAPIPLPGTRQRFLRIGTAAP